MKLYQDMVVIYQELSTRYGWGFLFLYISKTNKSLHNQQQGASDIVHSILLLEQFHVYNSLKKYIAFTHFDMEGKLQAIFYT